MAFKWVKEVEAEDVRDETFYFLATRPPTRMTPHLFHAEGLNGKKCWSQKPGIALRYKGSDFVREELKRNPNMVAVIVPNDADTRWRARKPRSDFQR
jgi:hypothetical protein